MNILDEEVERYMIDNWEQFTLDASDDMNRRILMFKDGLKNIEQTITLYRTELLHLLAVKEHYIQLIAQYEAAYGRAFTDGCKNLEA